MPDDGDYISSTATNVGFRRHCRVGSAGSLTDARVPMNSDFSTFRLRRAAGSFAWRGGEDSVSDREPNLVHMQARHYDPTLGRFLQADTLMLASFTTQGMNRYVYCENDPVNMSDACETRSGRLVANW